MDIATELQKLQQLRQSGAIDEEEYERANCAKKLGKGG